MKATFELPKNEIAATFKIQKVVPADDYALAADLENEVNRAIEQEQYLLEQIDTKQDKGDYATNSRIDGVVNAFDNEIETIDNRIDDLNTNKANKTDIPDVSIYATTESLNNLANTKQDKLIAGENITITGNVISSSGGRGASSFAELEGSPYDNQALASELNSLDIISLLAVFLRDNLGNQLLDSNGLKLTLRRI